MMAPLPMFTTSSRGSFFRGCGYGRCSVDVRVTDMRIVELRWVLSEVPSPQALHIRPSTDGDEIEKRKGRRKVRTTALANLQLKWRSPV
jgi:hypothetical protein